MAGLSGVVIAGICLAGVLLLIPLIGNIVYQLCYCKRKKKKDLEAAASLLKVGNNKPIPSGTLASINKLYNEQQAIPDPDYSPAPLPSSHLSENKTTGFASLENGQPSSATPKPPSSNPFSTKNWSYKKSSSKPAKQQRPHQHINPISPGYMYEYDGKHGSIYYVPDDN